jgi:hypothetical protein
VLRPYGGETQERSQGSLCHMAGAEWDAWRTASEGHPYERKRRLVAYGELNGSGVGLVFCAVDG